jgi:archaeal flagellar protein FlaJ
MKNKKKKPTYHKPKEHKKNKLKLLLLLLPIPFIISITAYLAGAKSTTIMAISALGLILIVAPYIFISFIAFRELKKAEDNYPNFLRDVSQNVSAGMTLPQAVSTSAESDYGALTKYIKKLNIWLSWSTPFPKAWDKFTNLLTKSVLIKRINSIILESFYSGGDLKKTLSSLADDVNLLKQMESEKKSVMNEQIVIMYIVYLIFVGVVIGLFKILAPILFIQKLGVFSGISFSDGGGGAELTIDYFKNLFFIMMLIESICAGIIAGQISEENIIAGFKHIMVMLSVGIFCFFVFIFPSHLTLDATIYPSSVPAEGNIIINGQVYYESSPASGATVSVITPQKNVYSLFVDNMGEFEKTIQAPAQKGAYDLIITVEFNNEKETVTRTFNVI